MKIWIDILTPKHLLFFESMIARLGGKNRILCTSREYGEVSKLAKIRNFDMVFVGRHGGGDRNSKLRAGIERTAKLARMIEEFSPDLTISFCSPDAARVSFGLGIRHIGFCDAPHAEAAMRLSIPLIQKLLIPYAIPKREFTRYGIREQDIIRYRSIDAAVTIKRKVDDGARLPFRDNGRKNIVIRTVEEQASYVQKPDRSIPIIEEIISRFGDENIVVLGRYPEQIRRLQGKVGGGARVVKMSFDGKHLLNSTDVFVGSGGTMTAEAAMMGVPTISYNGAPNLIEEFLIRKRLARRETDPKKIATQIARLFGSKKQSRQKAERIASQMEDPIEILIRVIREWSASR